MQTKFPIETELEQQVNAPFPIAIEQDAVEYALAPIIIELEIAPCAVAPTAVETKLLVVSRVIGEDAPAPVAPVVVAASKSDNYITIKSPMIGTFYRQSGPGKPIFINEGDDVIPGSSVCIIEAMKLFNEIESEVKGKIVKILVDDASPVEFDQPLFLVDPS